MGILAAGLLATIDPIEQFRKGADSNRKTTGLELVNAVIRYYATKGVMPWATVANGGDGCNAAAVPTGTLVTVTGFADCLTALINQGELRSTFPDQTAILKALYITQTGIAQTVGVAVCYNPESKTESLRAETKYSQSAGVPSGTCPSAGGDCYWCAQ